MKIETTTHSEQSNIVVTIGSIIGFAVITVIAITVFINTLYQILKL